MRRRLFTCLYDRGHRGLRGYASDARATRNYYREIVQQRALAVADIQIQPPLFSDRLGQPVIPLKRAPEVPAGVFTQHPFYRPDFVGSVTALMAPLDDAVERGLRTRVPGSPSNAVVEYMGPQDYSKDSPQLNVLVRYEPRESNDELSAQVEADADLVKLLTEFAQNDSALDRVLEDADKAICHFTKTALAQNLELSRIASLVLAYWRLPQTGVAEAMDPFYRVCSLVETARAHETHRLTVLPRRTRRLLTNLAESYMAEFRLVGLPEQLLPAYFDALLALDAFDEIVALLVKVRASGFTPEVDFVMRFLSAVENAKRPKRPDGTARMSFDECLSLCRPYFTSRANTPLGFGIALRHCRTIDEVYAVLDLCLAAHSKTDSIRANAGLFLSKAREVCDGPLVSQANALRIRAVLLAQVPDLDVQ